MKIQFILENDWTGEKHTVLVDDMVSPGGGYGVDYRERAGADYAKHRAPEQLGGDNYTCLSSTYIRHQK